MSHAGGVSIPFTAIVPAAGLGTLVIADVQGLELIQSGQMGEAGVGHGRIADLKLFQQ